MSERRGFHEMLDEWVEAYPPQLAPLIAEEIRAEWRAAAEAMAALHAVVVARRSPTGHQEPDA